MTMVAMKRKSDIPEEDAGPQMLVVVDRVVDPYLVCFHDPTGFRAEQFRALRNKLTVLNTDHASVTLVVTSAIQGEGKSTTALNLGMALAELEDHQILVAEFDFRRPSIERMLGLNPEPGLVELLHDGIGLDRAIRPSGFPTSTSSLREHVHRTRPNSSHRAASTNSSPSSKSSITT